MSEIIENPTENMPESSEEIDSEAEQITELIPEQIRYRGQRGPDKTPRIFNANSLRNLKQYQNIPIEKPKGSDKWIWIVVGMVVAVIVGILIWRIYEWQKDKNTSER